MPMPTSILGRPRCCHCRFRSSSASLISSVVRRARSASSGCATGAPNNAIIPSPTYLSTTPPCRSLVTRKLETVVHTYIASPRPVISHVGGAIGIGEIAVINNACLRLEPPFGVNRTRNAHEENYAVLIFIRWSAGLPAGSGAEPSCKLLPEASHRPEARGQRTEARGQRTEVRSQRSEVRRQRSEVRRQRSEGREQRAARFRQTGGPSGVSDLRNAENLKH